MAIYNEGGCCGASELFFDTDKMTEHVKVFHNAGEAFGSLARKVDVSVVSGLGVDAAVNGLGELLDDVFKSHAERANVTGETFDAAMKHIVGVDEESAARM